MGVFYFNRCNMPRPAPAPAGVTFPQNEKGERSTTDAQKKVWADTFRAIDSETAKQVEAERKWRYRYQYFIKEHVRESLASPSNALESAKEGLNSLHNTFEFIRDGETCSVAEAMKRYKGTFHTKTIKGEKPRPSQFDLEVPYKGRNLKGEALVRQVERWVKAGTIEPSAGEAITQVAQKSQWADLSDKYFVLLGAGSRCERDRCRSQPCSYLEAFDWSRS